MDKRRPIKILHVDDEGSHLEFTKMFLEELDEGVVVDSATNPEEALGLQEKNSYDCIVSDYKMLSMDGIELAQRVRERSNVPFILYTGQGSEDVAEQAFEAGIDDYIRKESEPSHYQILAKRIRQNVDKYRTEQLYRKVVNESRDGIIILTGMDIAFMNQAAAELFGCKTPNGFIGRSTLEYLVEPERRIRECLSGAPGDDESSHLFEVRYRTASGAIRVAEVSSSTINYLGQEAHLCFFRDITRRKRMEERLAALHRQASKLAQQRTLEEVAEATLDVMQTVFEYQLVSFQVVEDGYLKTVNLRGAPPLKLSLPLDGKGITVKAAREKHSILVNDLRGSEDYFKGSMESLSELAVPVVLDGETVAVLNVESMELDDFTEDDRKLLETLTYHVAFALNRERDSNGGVAGEAVRAMRLDYALGRLEDAEKVSSLVRGQLRDSLRSIKNASGILMDKPEMLPDLVSSIDREANHASKVAELITETLEASGRDADYVEINQIVKTVMGSMYIPRSVETKVSYQSGLLVSEVRRDKMTRVVENLVRNAVESMPNGGTLEVSISQIQGNARIEVRDQGEGIPLEAMDRLFEPFNSTKQGHAGLGLAFCKRTLESMGGSIEAIVDEKGTTMVVTVPLRNF
ncbi:MAG TPA: ATP-binding protein [Candidatus Krumholzibacteriaceae bacterium]|nr:ATP-binding protein [Candidatus Krumholzibacteriaceae bacterium]